MSMCNSEETGQRQEKAPNVDSRGAKTKQVTVAHAAEKERESASVRKCGDENTSQPLSLSVSLARRRGHSRRKLSGGKARHREWTVKTNAAARGAQKTNTKVPGSHHESPPTAGSSSKEDRRVDYVPLCPTSVRHLEIPAARRGSRATRRKKDKTTNSARKENDCLQYNGRILGQTNYTTETTLGATDCQPSPAAGSGVRTRDTVPPLWIVPSRQQ